MFINQNAIQKIIQEEIKDVLSEQSDEDEIKTAVEAALEPIEGITPEQKGLIVVGVKAALKTVART